MNLPPPPAQLSSQRFECQAGTSDSLRSINYRREVWLDWVRAFAVASIVFCHCVENTFDMSLVWFQSAPHGLRFVRDLLFTFGRLGVPLFLMLSGYLLFTRHPCREWADVLSFYRKKWLPLLLCWLSWIVIYGVINRFWLWPDGWQALGRQLLFMDYPPYGHVWYMPMIIGMYLAVPLLSMLMETGGRPMFWLLFLFSAVAAMVTPYVRLDLSFIGDKYVTYLLLGYLGFLIAPKIGCGRSLILLLISLVAVTGLTWAYYHSHKEGLDWNLWYTDSRLIFLSIVLFLSFRFTDGWQLSWVKAVSQGAFAIYLMHYPVLAFVKSTDWVTRSAQPWVNTGLLFASTFTLTFLLFLVLRRSRSVARYLFLTK